MIPTPEPEPVPAPDKAPQSLRHGPQIDRVYAALRKEFPLLGKAPKSLPINRITKRLRRHWKTEREEEGLTDPSPDVVAAAVEQLGRSDH
jgi:hypothetical protein